LSLLLD